MKRRIFFLFFNPQVKPWKWWEAALWMWSETDEPSVGQRRVSLLGGRTLLVNGQNQIVQLGNYCYSSLKVAYIDEVEIKPWKINTTLSQTICLNHFALRVGKNGYILLRLELWPQGSKNQQQNSNTNKIYLNVKAQYIWWHLTFEL